MLKTDLSGDLKRPRFPAMADKPALRAREAEEAKHGYLEFPGHARAGRARRPRVGLLPALLQASVIGGGWSLPSFQPRIGQLAPLPPPPPNLAAEATTRAFPMSAAPRRRPSMPSARRRHPGGGAGSDAWTRPLGKQAEMFFSLSVAAELERAIEKI